LVKGFLAKNNVTTLEHTPYSSYLAPADFYLFPPLKSALKGRHCDATDIIKDGREGLKRLSQNSFQECFQNLDSCWQKCIVAQENYFEGNVVKMIVIFCILSEIK